MPFAFSNWQQGGGQGGGGSLVGGQMANVWWEFKHAALRKGNPVMLAVSAPRSPLSRSSSSSSPAAVAARAGTSQDGSSASSSFVDDDGEV